MILSALQRVAGLMGAEQIDAAPHLISDAVDLAAGVDSAVAVRAGRRPAQAQAGDVGSAGASSG